MRGFTPRSVFLPGAGAGCQKSSSPANGELFEGLDYFLPFFLPFLAFALGGFPVTGDGAGFFAAGIPASFPLKVMTCAIRDFGRVRSSPPVCARYVEKGGSGFALNPSLSTEPLPWGYDFLLEQPSFLNVSL